jgi:hypothetical protein
MANKRMFDKKVVGSDKFLDLPNSSKALYFMAGMEADDKGFFQPRKLQKMCGFSDDDYKILIAKRFFIAFESGVMVVTDWNKNNWLDSRRISETEYVDELNLLKLVNEKYELVTENTQFAKQMLSQNSIEENSIEENNNIYANVRKNTLFKKFWDAYPKKRDKGRVENWFSKHKPNEELVELMIKQIERLKDTKSWKENNGQYIPYPSTWLNAKGWEDEFETDSEREERIDREIMEGTYGT